MLPMLAAVPTVAALILLAVGPVAAAQSAVPPLTGRVVDAAEILSPETESALTAQLAAAEGSTGAQIVVLAVPGLAGESVEELAERAFNKWALGDAERDDGVLLLVARDDRELRIEVGYGLEGTLTDSQTGRIIRGVIVPRFRQGDFDGGVSEGVAAIVGTLDGSYAPPSSAPGRPAAAIPWVMRLGFGLMFGLMPLLAFVPTLFVAGRLSGLVMMSLFVTIGFGMLFASVWAGSAALLVYAASLLLAEWRFRQVDSWRDSRARVAAALDENEGRRVRVDLGGRTVTVGGVRSGRGAGGSGGGWSGGSSGGGFSGGGGSSGGGGASGSW